MSSEVPLPGLPVPAPRLPSGKGQQMNPARLAMGMKSVSLGPWKS